MGKRYRVAVIEPLSSLGGEIIRILEERNFPIQEIIPLGAPRNLGRTVDFAGFSLRAGVLEAKALSGVDLAFFTTDRSLSREYSPKAVQQGCTVIDCSSEFSLHEQVPLVIPEINAALIKKHSGIIASPGSSTIQLVLPLYPIHKAARIRRILVSTYQAVSDNGQRALDELSEQIRNLFTFQEVHSEVYPHQIAFNILPHVGSFSSSAYTDGELSLMNETKKIFEDEKIRISATAVRVPVFYAHSESVHFETARKITPEEARKMITAMPGVYVTDDPAGASYPTAVGAAGRDECFVGRIREDASFDNGLALWTVCDNLRKGSALNAVQIAEHLVGNTP
ncbi:MAG TPA: aspartate-semialdehyde dehydrogenase [Deltaproteobacteria bacterium]|nr:aspartate-semialdehyde dehydrogenase [Deltaproteobacteria bacterium]